MKKDFVLVVSTIFSCIALFAQNKNNVYEKPRIDQVGQAWADSVFNTLSKDDKIAQLMIIRAHSNLGADHVEKVTELVRKFNVGGLCFFQGGPVRQANLTNSYQRIARTPLLITIDAEWGLGMRLDSVIDLPYQLTLGAVSDANLIYQMGRVVGEQCKRIGVHVNYAPVVDINNNPNNPVIGYRSFGEDKYQVSKLGVAYMQGMQDAGVMACAKHFPGHGDTEVDSHLDLPLINKNRTELDSLELLPFNALIKAGVGSVMIAHLYIPSIDNTTNRATSLSKNNVTKLLKDDLGFSGLTFTDALEMKGITKFYPGGEASLQALIAGNDMLCLPESVPGAIEEVKKAIKDKKLSWKDIDQKVMKVLLAKFRLGLNQLKPIAVENLLNDLNEKADIIRYQVAENSLTLLHSENESLPDLKGKKVAYVGIGTEQNLFSQRLKEEWNADNFFFSYKDSKNKSLEIIDRIKKAKYDVVLIGIHNFALRPVNNYNISSAAIDLWQQLQSTTSITLVFGNVYATKNFCAAKNLVACYQDDTITQDVAADLVGGRIYARGRLPVGICDLKFGEGIIITPASRMAFTGNESPTSSLIDSIVYDAISKRAFPGCVVLAIKDGEVIYHKAFGNYQYEASRPVTAESIYDVASVTKISATTISVMKLYEQGKLDLRKKLGDYLPWVRGSNKQNLVISDILLHQAGLNPFIPFYRETIDTITGIPSPALYIENANPGYTRVAEKLYLRKDWNDTMFKRILESPLLPGKKYVYSDNDFIFLGKIIEAISGMSLDEYVQKIFYNRLGLTSTGFKPRNRFVLNRIVPTEEEKHFRRQLIQGDVHDEGASMFGGVSGHAGLFSSAYDLGMLYQMLLNGGELNGEYFLKPATVKYFTDYHSSISRRGLGFDKPEKDNATRREPYPTLSASSATFGHTGFTGTCVWVDPKYKLIYIFLSNRVYPTRNNPLLSTLNVRGNIQEAIYKMIKPEDKKAF